MTYADPSPWTMGFVVLIVALSYGRERVGAAVSRWRERRAPSALEELHAEYETTRMTEREFEQRLEDLMEPGDERTRDELQEVGGVGEIVAEEIAIHFDSLEHVRQADRADLEEVPDVGPSRAESIVRHFE